MLNSPCARSPLVWRVSLRLLWAALVLGSVLRGEVVYPAGSGGLVPIADLATVAGTVFVLHDREIVRSVDTGLTWIRFKTPAPGRSLYFLNADEGWLVAADGVYRTQDGGAKWRRILKSKDLLRCWFLTAKHGYAVGNRKTALETVDAGKTWRTLEAATGVLSDPERTTFTGVEFSGNTGFISGYHTPKRPARDSSGRQWPQLGILVQTVDGGQNWKPSASAVFGRLARAHVAGRRAALMLQFDYEFEWPSEVYSIDLPTGETTREYRETDRRVCAMTLLGARGVAVAAVRLSKNRMPGPRPLEFRVGAEDVEIDERLTAETCYLQRDGQTLWLATDVGFVEKLAVP
jgi:Photosynthesis system II assembly factor YCF48